MKISIPIFLALFASGSLCNISAAVPIPLNPPEFRLIYDYSRRVDITTPAARLHHSIAPYLLDTIENNNPTIATFRNPSADQVLLLLFPSGDFRSAKYARGLGYKSIRGGIAAAPFERISIFTNFYLDEKLSKDPNYTGEKWRGLAGEMENAFIFYGGNNIEILAGRFSSNWGPGNESLILSSTARPMDALSLRIKWHRLFFTSQFGQLQRLISPDSATTFENRFFSAHRLDIKLSENFYLGLFESIIYGGKGRSFEIPYINPLMLFHSVQLNDNVDDNTFFGLDFAFFIKSRHKIYGQLLIDDFQIDHKESSDNEPNELGATLGFHSLNLFGLFDLRGEYLRINNRVYNQFLSRNRYVNRGRLIGNNFGPDGDRWSISFEKWLHPDSRLALGLSYQRKGEGKFNDNWTTPWLSSESDYSETFPTGIVERTLTAQFGFEGYLNKYIFLDSKAGLEHIANFAHTKNDNRSIPFISLRITACLTKAFKIL